MWMTPTTAAANGRPTNLQLPVSDMPTKSTSSTTYPSTTPQHYLPTWEDYAYPTENPRLPSNAPVPVSNPPSSQRIAVIEYQWAHELVTSLLGQPPRSNFGGKFAIIADPDVDHPTRAQMFANQIRFQGIPISYVPFHSQSHSYPSIQPSYHFPRTGKNILRRAPRATSPHTRCSSPAGARKDVVAASLSLPVTTPRIRMGCVVSASASGSTTPRLKIPGNRQSPTIRATYAAHVCNLPLPWLTLDLDFIQSGTVVPTSLAFRLVVPRPDLTSRSRPRTGSSCLLKSQSAGKRHWRGEKRSSRLEASGGSPRTLGMHDPIRDRI